jgi:hypothetical protein
VIVGLGLLPAPGTLVETEKSERPTGMPRDDLHVLLRIRRHASASLACNALRKVNAGVTRRQ